MRAILSSIEEAQVPSLPNGFDAALPRMGNCSNLHSTVFRPKFTVTDSPLKPEMTANELAFYRRESAVIENKFQVG